MSRQERSAGFVAYFQPQSAAVRFLLLNYGRHWDFTKGHVERDEDDLTAAIRELQEETEISHPRVVDGFREEMRYFFRNPKRGLVQKTVVFFLAEVSTTAVTLSHEHSGYEFLEYLAARQRLTFPNARKILDAAWQRLGLATATTGDKLSQGNLFP